LPLSVKFGRFHWSAGWLMTLLTLVAVALFTRLGFWQWQRAQEKTALQARFDAGSAAITDLGPRASDALARYTQVRLQGAYDVQHQFLLDNISHHAMPGYEVLTPLNLQDGRTVMVNRGWVPLTRSRSQLPEVGFDPGSVRTITGRLDQLPVVGIALGHQAPDTGAQWPKLTSFPTMSDLSSALQRPLEARQLLLDPAESFGFVREWQLAGFAPGRHLSYAVQWWGFAALALVLYGLLNRRRSLP
jgi:surfeit locus 1 family protein